MKISTLLFKQPILNNFRIALSYFLSKIMDTLLICMRELRNLRNFYMMKALIFYKSHPIGYDHGPEFSILLKRLLWAPSLFSFSSKLLSKI